MFIHAPKEPASERLGASGGELRRHNTCLLLKMIWDQPQGISRADLARRVGLSPSTVSGITQGLLDDGLIQEARQDRSTGGRPPILLRFAAERGAVLGLEFGASHVSCVTTDLRGNLERHASQPCAVDRDPKAALALARRFLEQALGDLPRDRQPIGVGVAVPCPLDPLEPGMLSTRVMPAWSNIDLCGEVYEHIELPVLLDNDANLGALAESWWGAGQGLDFTYVKVATGIGAGHIVGGQIFRGAAGVAGEIGHSAVTQDGRECRCGLRGCLEAEAGVQGILDRARQRRAEQAGSLLDELDPLTLADVVQAARQGDPVAVEVIRQAGHMLGIALANLVNLVNPARVILGGQVTMAGDLLLRPVRKAMRERALATSFERTEVRISELRPGAVARGAATLVLQWALNHPATLIGRSTSTPSHARTRLLEPAPALG